MRKKNKNKPLKLLVKMISASLKNIYFLLYHMQSLGIVTGHCHKIIKKRRSYRGDERDLSLTRNIKKYIFPIFTVFLLQSYLSLFDIIAIETFGDSH